MPRTEASNLQREIRMDKFNVYALVPGSDLLIVKQESDKSIIYNVLKLLDQKRVNGVSVHGGNISGEMSVSEAIKLFNE